MPVYNVAVPVIALVEAGSEAEAVAALTAALTRAKFDTYADEVPGPNAFEAEPDTTADLDSRGYPIKIGA